MKKSKRSLGLLFSIRRTALNPERSRKIFNSDLIHATLAVLLTAFLWAQTATAQEVKPFKDFTSYVTSRLSKLGFRFVKEKRPSIC
jgi:hypothetical protein